MSVTYTVAVSNAGPNAATAVQVVESLADGFTYVSATSRDPAWGCTQHGQTVTCTLPQLAPHSAAPPIAIVATVTVPAGQLPASLRTVATVSSATHDPAGGSLSNQAFVFTDVVGDADLAVAIAQRRDAIQATTSTDCNANNCQTYTVTLTNHGPAPATGVDLAVFTPGYGTLVDVTSPDLACTQIGYLDCVATTLAPGAVATVTVRWLAPSSAANSLNIEADVSSDADPTSSNDEALATTTVTP